MTDVYAEEIAIFKGIIGKPLEIMLMGHPALKKKAKTVDDPTDPKIHQIVADMLATINKLGKETVAGLAAPQLDVNLRILLFQVPEHRANGTNALPFTVLINPTIEPIGNQKELGWEACLSIPDLIGEVSRYKQIRYSYQTLEGKTITREAHDFHARVLQHEVDHIDGYVYIERMENMKQLYFKSEFKAYNIQN